MKTTKFKDYQNEIVELRRYFHAHPELSLKEYSTADYIEKYLNKLEYNKILEDANKNPESMKHKEQVKSSFIGIGTDGKPVNMDLWRTSKKGDGTWGIFSCESAYAWEDAYDGG